MEMTGREMIEKRLDAWPLAAPLMEQFRAEDLLALSDEAAARLFVGLTRGPILYDVPDDGLIEQQRITQMLATWKSQAPSSPPHRSCMVFAQIMVRLRKMVERTDAM